MAKKGKSQKVKRIKEVKSRIQIIKELAKEESKEPRFIPLKKEEKWGEDEENFIPVSRGNPRRQVILENEVDTSPQQEQRSPQRKREERTVSYTSISKDEGSTRHSYTELRDYASTHDYNELAKSAEDRTSQSPQQSRERRDTDSWQAEALEKRDEARQEQGPRKRYKNQRE